MLLIFHQPEYKQTSYTNPFWKVAKLEVGKRADQDGTGPAKFNLAGRDNTADET